MSLFLLRCTHTGMRSFVDINYAHGVPYNLSHMIRENEPVTHPRLSSCNIGTILPVTHGEHKSHWAEYRFIINGTDPLRGEEDPHHEKKYYSHPFQRITLKLPSKQIWFNRHSILPLIFPQSRIQIANCSSNRQYLIFIMIYATWRLTVNLTMKCYFINLIK